MNEIINELRELEQMYADYKGVDRFVVNDEQNMGNGVIVVIDGTNIPSSFTRLMSSPKTGVSWIEPSGSVNIKMTVQRDSTFQANK